MIKLIAGLGNPGPEYEHTRHNAGFWWVDEAARLLKVSLQMERSHFGLVARTSVGGQSVWLVEPQTFMNLSGKSVGSLARFFKIAPEEVLVVHDELDLPPGGIRLKQGGGNGGHNGLKDIIARMGNNNNFFRLRLGIGHPGAKELVAGFWIWQCASLQEAIDWVKRCPNPMRGESEIEIRRVFEAEDFGEAFTPELREQEERLREQLIAQHKR